MDEFNKDYHKGYHDGYKAGYEQGRNDFADENGYPDDDNADDLPLAADDFDVEYELGGEG